MGRELEAEPRKLEPWHTEWIYDRTDTDRGTPADNGRPQVGQMESWSKKGSYGKTATTRDQVAEVEPSLWAKVGFWLEQTRKSTALATAISLWMR